MEGSLGEYWQLSFERHMLWIFHTFWGGGGLGGVGRVSMPDFCFALCSRCVEQDEVYNCQELLNCAVVCFRPLCFGWIWPILG